MKLIIYSFPAKGNEDTGLCLQYNRGMQIPEERVCKCVFSIGLHLSTPV